MPVAADQRNWMPFCRSAPVSPGTWSASPGCVPPTAAAPGGSFRPIGPVSLRQFAGCAVGIRRRGRFGGLWVGILLVQTQALGSFRPVHHYALQRRLGVFHIMDNSSGHHHGQWPAVPVDQDAFLASCLAPVRGIVSNSPPNAPSPWSNRRTVIPNLRRPTPCILRSGRLRYPRSPHALPSAVSQGEIRWMVLSSPNSLCKCFHWQDVNRRDH